MKPLHLAALLALSLAMPVQAVAEAVYQYREGQDPRLQQFSGKPWWDILSFCAGAMMVINQEPSADIKLREDAFQYMTLTLMPRLNRTGMPMEQLQGRSTQYAEGLHASGMFTDANERITAMNLCLIAVPKQFDSESLGGVVAPPAPQP